MDSRTPMKIGFDSLAILLVTSGITVATTSETTNRMALGLMLIVLGILTYIVRHTWNQKMIDKKYGGRNGDEKKEEKEEPAQECKKKTKRLLKNKEKEE